MPTIFSKWNGKGLKPPVQSRFGPGISSTDLTAGSEDAVELNGVPGASSRLPTPDIKIQADKSIVIQKALPKPQQDLSEFGARGSLPISQTTSNIKHNRYATEPRHVSTKATFSSLSTMSKPVPPVPVPVSAEAGSTSAHPPTYGYTTTGWDTQMDVAKAAEILLACGEQIRARGLDSPLIFSSMALDLSAHNVTSLIQSYLHTPALFFSSDVKFANAHDLAATIKWALARLGRVFSIPVPVQEQTRRGDPAAEEYILIYQRGFIDFEEYTSWAALEKSE
jgi:hypothetical protein